MAHSGSPARTAQGHVQPSSPEFCSPPKRWGEVRAPSLAREWLRITNELLIVEDPEPAPRSPNKLMCVNGAERRKVVRALSGFKRRTEVLVL